MNDLADRFDWYEPHQRWIASGGAFGAIAALTEADLTDADLAGAILACVAFAGARLAGADLRGADLRDAHMRHADLRGADLRGADIRRAELRGADLRDAKGIASIGPVGRRGRMIYAVDHGDRVMIQAGCRWATADEVRAAVRADYADDPREVAYLAAIDAIEAIVIAGRAA